jgi:hypothetical protein
MLIKYHALIRCLAGLSPISAWILHIGLPYIAAHLILIAAAFCREAKLSPYHAAVVFTPQAEVLLCVLAILIGGAALFDYLDKNTPR